MFERPWELFFNNRIRKIFSEKKRVVDIGGGLRIAQEKNNRYDPSREWIRPYLAHVVYEVMDPVADYHPDIVGDIHALPFIDGSVEALLCLAVLEHVENPIQACAEMERVLAPGGYCLLYVPFLYYYHAEKGYYGDYWRYTPDTLTMLFKRFAICEIMPVRGAIETLVRLTPLGRFGWAGNLGYALDRITGKLGSKQVSGYYVFVQK